MNNRIHPGLNTPFNPYERAGQARRPAAPEKIDPPSHGKEFTPSAPAKDAAPAANLTDAEQHLIEHYFPATSKLSLRLYGPGRSSLTLTPNAVGNRIDLKG
jgi:hypothetical protein